MRAGELDREVKLLLGTKTRDGTFGAEKVEYVELDTVWAKLQESAGAVAGGRADLAGHAWPHRITIRWRADVCIPLRVELDDGRIVQIEGIARIGRENGMVLAGMEWGHQQS